MKNILWAKSFFPIKTSCFYFCKHISWVHNHEYIKICFGIIDTDLRCIFDWIRILIYQADAISESHLSDFHESHFLFVIFIFHIHEYSSHVTRQWLYILYPSKHLFQAVKSYILFSKLTYNIWFCDQKPNTLSIIHNYIKISSPSNAQTQSCQQWFSQSDHFLHPKN